MTINEMNKTALNKVFETYLDASRALRKGQLADSERYHRLAFTMAEAYQAIGLMSFSDKPAPRNQGRKTGHQGMARRPHSVTRTRSPQPATRRA